MLQSKRSVMKFNIPQLENWDKFNDVLVGEAVGHPDFKDGQRVMTNKIKLLDDKLGFAYCLDSEVWQLGIQAKLSVYEKEKIKRFFT